MIRIASTVRSPGPTSFPQPHPQRTRDITADNGRTTFSVDGEVLFVYMDAETLQVGWFGFRSTAAQHQMGAFQGL
ncbi:DUF6250 domain-containing protein [Dyadobacter soli]|uniref:DUF6250 domain-containing protein n=1 Tax=Dyadobacter soli TaxID=659014 RepID=UPI0035B5709B